MIRAVIFDMFETLITHYQSPLYFGVHMAKNAGIPEEKFLALWKPPDTSRTIGEMTLEEVLERIFRENQCYSEKLLKEITEKRVAAKRECFRHLHSEILPMLSGIKEKGVSIGLISNCFSEEVGVIRQSELFPYFDAVYLSYEQGIMKPNREIFKRCMDELSVTPEECLYVGDGGSFELEAASELGMTAVQAVWYLNERAAGLRKQEFSAAECPLDILKYLEK